MSDIFILDTATLTWKNGTSGRTIRRGAACAISGDYFIAWGADTTNFTENITHENVTLTYNLKTDQWTTNYIAPPVAIPSTTPLTDTDTKPTEGGAFDESGHIGAIAGVVVGALVIGLITGGIVEYWSHKRRSKVSSPDVATNSVDLDDGDDSRKETVHVGTYGTRYDEQHPHACP